MIIDKKVFSGIIFYQQFKKNVYFCKLNFDEKRNKIILQKDEKNIPTVPEKESQ